MKYFVLGFLDKEADEWRRTEECFVYEDELRRVGHYL